MSNYSLKFQDKYSYEIRASGRRTLTVEKYEDALVQAIEAYKLGSEDVHIVGTKSQEFMYVSPEEIKEEIEEDLLTFEVSDVEYWVEVGAPKELLKKLAQLMNDLEIASFKLDLKDFSLKEGVQFVKR